MRRDSSSVVRSRWPRRTSVSAEFRAQSVNRSNDVLPELLGPTRIVTPRVRSSAVRRNPRRFSTSRPHSEIVTQRLYRVAVPSDKISGEWTCRTSGLGTLSSHNNYDGSPRTSCCASLCEASVASAASNSFLLRQGGRAAGEQDPVPFRKIFCVVDREDRTADLDRLRSCVQRAALLARLDDKHRARKSCDRGVPRHHGPRGPRLARREFRQSEDVVPVEGQAGKCALALEMFDALIQNQGGRGVAGLPETRPLG
jgi:hypothetical protein